MSVCTHMKNPTRCWQCLTAERDRLRGELRECLTLTLPSTEMYRLVMRARIEAALAGATDQPDALTCDSATGVPMDSREYATPLDAHDRALIDAAWEQHKAACIVGDGRTVLDLMVDRFLSWPLPKSVCADLVATMGDTAGRTGTNLLTATEARAMLDHVTDAKAIWALLNGPADNAAAPAPQPSAALNPEQLDRANVARGNESVRLLAALGLDAERFLTECGFINVPKVVAALKYPRDYAGLYLSPPTLEQPHEPQYRTSEQSPHMCINCGKAPVNHGLDWRCPTDNGTPEP